MLLKIFSPTSELVFREDTEKVTIALSKRSVDFFKKRLALMAPSISG